MPPMLVLQRNCMFSRRLKVLAKLHQLRPQRPHRLVLLHTIAKRHHNHHPNPTLRPSKRHRLPMIPPRSRNHPLHLRPFPPQPIHIDQPTPNLERPHRRMVLMLHPDLRASPRIQQRPTVLRSRRHTFVDQLRRTPNLTQPREPVLTWHHAPFAHPPESNKT
jgi:hypothetical protein